MSGFNFQGCVFIEGLSNAALQVADAKPGDCRNGNHVSEGQIVLWYHIFRQQIRELCTGERKGTEILLKLIFSSQQTAKICSHKGSSDARK